MRLTLNKEDINILMTLTKDDHLELHTKLQQQMQSHMNKDISKKQNSIQLATKSREDAAQNKILNAINLLRIESKDITTYSIAKVSGCSYNTVKKYYKAKQ